MAYEPNRDVRWKLDDARTEIANEAASQAMNVLSAYGVVTRDGKSMMASKLAEKIADEISFAMDLTVR